MKICAYVQDGYAKQVYKTECFDVRAWIGLKVIIDVLERNGYTIEYAGKVNAHLYDIILVSITSDCDWWQFIAERLTWRKGNYKVIIGGAGVLNIRPFLDMADIFIFGRGEDLITQVIKTHETNNRFEHSSVCYADTFNPDGQYCICQVNKSYPHKIKLTNENDFTEGEIGCPHKCLFCGYTWHRKYIGGGEFKSGSGIFSKNNREYSMLDMYKNQKIDYSHIRITAIDGISEKQRLKVKKPITREVMHWFYKSLCDNMDKPHQIKIYNIVGYPDETEDDFRQFIDDIKAIDGKYTFNNKQWAIVLHCTPFRAMPATPAACWAMSYKNYRGKIAQLMGQNRLKGNLLYQGNRIWAVESMGTDALPAVALSAICHRGTEKDSQNIKRLAVTNKFWNANVFEKQKVLEANFDLKTLFGKFDRHTLPTKYLRTYSDYGIKEKI